MRMRNHIIVAMTLFCSPLMQLDACDAQENSSALSSKLAKTIAELKNATSMSYIITSYRRGRGDDQQRWVTRGSLKLMYKAPSRYRDVRYDDNGNVRSIEIVDSSSGKTLRIDMLERKAYWLHSPSNVYGPVSPASNFAGLVERVPKPAIGQRNLNGMTVDIYRFAGKRSMDLWIDSESGRLVGTSNPGADQFDPDADIAEDGPTLTSGRIESEIVYGGSVNDELFEFKVPEGFDTVEAPDRPGEEDLIEWLSVTARFGGGVFHATQRGFEMKELQASRSDANRKDEGEALSELLGKHMRDRNLPLVQSFIKGNAVEGSFRYVGGGIKLGSDREIVCWYTLKETGQIRAIYGDLSVKDIQERDLPADPQ